MGKRKKTIEAWGAKGKELKAKDSKLHALSSMLRVSASPCLDFIILRPFQLCRFSHESQGKNH